MSHKIIKNNENLFPGHKTFIQVFTKARSGYKAMFSGLIFTPDSYLLLFSDYFLLIIS